MDRWHNGTYGRAPKSTLGPVLEGRPSLEPTAPSISSPVQHSISRLQKKRSDAGVRNTSTGPSANVNTVNPGMRASNSLVGAFGAGGKARTGSIRNAMKKIFGRRSRLVEPQPAPEPVRISPPRHQHHRSESSAWPPPIQIPERDMYNPAPSPSPRTFHPESYQLMPPASNGKRTGSPYAVQFPKSAQLKPLDLGNPFATPSNQLRRRKTLPTIFPAEDGPNATHPSNLSPSDPPPVPPLPTEIGIATSGIGRPVTRDSNASKSKRRSRSLEDVKRSTATDVTSLRQRSEEIQSWRDSIQGDTRGIIGLARSVPVSETIGEREEDDTPTATRDPFDDTDAPPIILQHSPVRLSIPSLGDPDFASQDIDLAQDLEDRVAKLEAGLRTFQRSLQRLTAVRNRRTVILGNVPARRSSDDVRTPSMLADTLRDLLEPTSFETQPPETSIPQRPSTSPQPQSPSRTDDPFTVDFPPLPPSMRPPEPLPPSPPRSSPPLPGFDPVRSSIRTSATIDPAQLPSQPYSFHSLYQMLADERSARRRLETELRDLRDELSDLHSQVASSSSNVHSQRSSYLPTDPAAGSARLRELLRETEAHPSPPPHHHNQQQQQQQQFSRPPPPPPLPLSSLWPQHLSTSHNQATSRFSGSESEGSGLDDLQTPVEAYQTPAEERDRWHLDATRASEEGIA